MPAQKRLPSAESNPSQGSQKVSYIMGLGVQAATLAVQEAEEGIQVQSLPGLEKAFTISPGHAFKTNSRPATTNSVPEKWLCI